MFEAEQAATVALKQQVMTSLVSLRQAHSRQLEALRAKIGPWRSSSWTLAPLITRWTHRLSVGSRLWRQIAVCRIVQLPGSEL